MSHAAAASWLLRCLCKHMSISTISVLQQISNPGCRLVGLHAMNVCSHLQVILHVHYYKQYEGCLQVVHTNIPRANMELYTWSRNGDGVVGWVLAQLQTKLCDFIVDMLWQTNICIYVVDVDPLHGMLSLGDGLQALLRSTTSKRQCNEFER